MTPPKQSPARQATTAGRAHGGKSLAPARWASSTWESDGLDDANRRATSIRHNHFYCQCANPTVEQFELAVAEAALAFGSGMGAVAATVFALCGTGSHIVAERQPYAGTLAFLQGPCQRMGLDVTFIDVSTPGAFAETVIPGRTMLVIAESPSNPRLELADLDELGGIRGPFMLVDSTFATPLGQQPLTHGVDISLHSATKGIAGHNDATLGVIAGDHDLLDDIWADAVLHGSTPSPFDALNALRGIRTLGVRTRQQNKSARSIAVMLADHPMVSIVHYPGLSEHPQHALASRQGRGPSCCSALSCVSADRPVRHFARRTRDTRLPPCDHDPCKPDAGRAGCDESHRRANLPVDRPRGNRRHLRRHRAGPRSAAVTTQLRAVKHRHRARDRLVAHPTIESNGATF